MRLNKLFFIIITISLLVACGRKNNNFLVFVPKEKIVKINKLTLPVVQGVKIKQLKEGSTQIVWYPLNTHINHAELIGYNAYKFAQTAFIPRKPINKQPIKQPSYIDTSKNKNHLQYCYLVRALFITHGKTIEGPASKIVLK